MTILLTGFTPFGKVAVNPSQLIIAQVAARREPDVITAVLPVEYAASGRSMAELIRIYQPDAVLCLGVAANRQAISLERVALNLDDAALPDNAGDQASGRLILPDGPLAYWSTLPLEAMLAALHARGLPAVISNHAGAYVCNHVFYVARHTLDRMDSRAACGFVHVPALREGDDTNGLPLAQMVEAVDCCLNVLRNL